MLGRDREPVDFSREEVMAQFIESMGAWMKAKVEDTSGNSFGFVDIKGGPYGVAYVY